MHIFEVSNQIIMKTLTQTIKENHYLNVNNLTDVADCDSAINELERLDAIHGSENKTLLKLWAKVLAKKKSLIIK